MINKEVKNKEKILIDNSIDTPKALDPVKKIAFNEIKPEISQHKKFIKLPLHEFKNKINDQETKESQAISRFMKALIKRSDNRNTERISPTANRGLKQKLFQLNFSTERRSQPTLAKGYNPDKPRDQASLQFPVLDPSKRSLGKNYFLSKKATSVKGRPLADSSLNLNAKARDGSIEVNMLTNKDEELNNILQVRNHGSKMKLKVPLSPYELRINYLKKQLLSNEGDHESSTQLEMAILDDFKKFYDEK